MEDTGTGKGQVTQRFILPKQQLELAQLLPATVPESRL